MTGEFGVRLDEGGEGMDGVRGDEGNGGVDEGGEVGGVVFGEEEQG